MLKSAITILGAISIAIGGGAASVWYALIAPDGVGTVTINGWTAFPEAGTPDADSYSKARLSREGLLALGRAEGLAFTAQHDAGGETLRAECDYRLEGSVPAARFYTLQATDLVDDPIPSGKRRVAAVSSYELVRGRDGVVVAVGPHARPGNWLPLSVSGPMTLVLTFYDTPIASSTGIEDIQMPQIVKVGCSG